MKTSAILPVFLILFFALAAASFAQETEPVQQLKEQVKCLFIGSSSEQSCYSESWKCTGTESCSIGVSGEKNRALTWKSTCGNFATTTIDGNNEEITFKCEQAATTQPAQPATPPAEQASEQVTCLFQNSNSQQKCYSTNAVCYGTSSCTATVSGDKGKTLLWMSSCSGTAATTIDGSNEEMKFTCEPQASIQPAPEQPSTTKPVPSPSIPEQPATTQPVQSPPTTVLFVKEQVKCIFTNSNTDQKCYTEDGRYGCAGMGSCTADVGGGQGTKLGWKSTCSGNAITAITVVDGNNDYAEFKCEQSAASGGASGSTAPAAPAVPVEAAKEQVKCMFIGSTTEQKCYGDGVFSCAGVGTCVADASGDKGRRVIWKSTCGGYAYTVIDGNSEYAEFNCGAQPSTGSGEAVSTVPARPGMSEKVWCIFLNSDVLTNPHAGLVEECYTDDRKFACRWSGNVAEENGKRYAYCVADAFGEPGTKLTWKSTCGGYAYSVMDNKEEKVEFQCTPSANVTMNQISGKGFKRSYWQCYDSAEEKQVASTSVDCMTSEMWQERAQAFCKGHCSAETGKCGVNSFSVSEECYIDVANEGAAFMTPQPAETIPAVEATDATATSQPAKNTGTTPSEGGEKAIMEPAPIEEPMLVCKDSCPLDSKCYPFGYRKGGNFCYDDGAFRGQLGADSACENNFECTTNLCVDSKCMSSGLIQKILSWFKSLFG